MVPQALYMHFYWVLNPEQKIYTVNSQGEPPMARHQQNESGDGTDMTMKNTKP